MSNQQSPYPYDPYEYGGGGADGRQDPQAQSWQGAGWSEDGTQALRPPQQSRPDGTAYSDAAAYVDAAYAPPQGAGHPQQYPEAPPAQAAAYAARAQHQPQVHPYPQPQAQAYPQPQHPYPQSQPQPQAEPVPTVTPDAPLTAAQRARAEGRSPIIAPGIQPAVLTVVLSLLLAGAAATGEALVTVLPLVLLQAVTAAGWFRLNGMWPARQGIALAFAGGLAVDVVLLTVGEDHAPASIIGTLGVWVLFVLVLQLRNRSSADERMYALTATVTSSALAIVAAGHLAAEPDAVVAGACAVALGTLVRALPLPAPVSVAAALAAAAGAGAAAGRFTDVGAQGGALLGLAAGVCALVGLRVASYDYPSRFVHMTAGVALPLMAAAPAVYLIGRAVG
ncbi:hypothetical protein [Streptomyces sp. GC420]|uniref:hypothetical protein n=1 Tax=Streptomyces sp. GC420 TaxID=2697568 RepID=UPI00141508E0|nr:hypothetical protein [Streptomyces sp. GC420]NBM18258.1 hypothetical protein [Streptomyces sp. GC420]